MGVVSNEPSMEDILSSIKRIIADGGSERAPARGKRRAASPREESDLDELAVDAEGETEIARIDSEVDDGDGDVAVLELTDMVEETAEMTASAAPAPQDVAEAASLSSAAAAVSARISDTILSDSSAQAARQSLSQLSSMLVRPQEGEANTLEGLVREMLRPVLKEWLEANLPELVESMVKKEIDRIVGRLG